MASMEFLTSKAGVMLALAVVGLVALAVVARNWSCRQSFWDRREERKEERRQRSVTCRVLDVLDGSRMLVAWGRRDKGQREVVLQGVEVPPNASVSAAFHLEGLTVGESVRVEYESHRLFAAGDGEAELESAEMEATAPIVGIVYGDGNVCLNVEQIFAGLARCNADANEIMRAAEKTAKREKKGIWR